MPLSDVQICQLALTRIGSTATINSLNPQQDSSTETAVLSVVYPLSRDYVLASFPWPFAKVTAVLAQVSTTGIPWSQEWYYAYAMPGDCLKMRRIVPTLPPPTGNPPQTTGPGQQPYMGYAPWHRADGNPYPIPFERGQGPNGALILTDFGGVCVPTGIYTQYSTNSLMWDPQFQSLLAWRVAMDASMGLAVNAAMRAQAEKGYEMECYQARCSDMNESQGDAKNIPYKSAFVRSRFGRW